MGMDLIIEKLLIRGLGPLSLTVAAGTCVGLSGPSGIGKSSLLRAVADMEPHWVRHQHQSRKQQPSAVTHPIQQINSYRSPKIAEIPCNPIKNLTHQIGQHNYPYFVPKSGNW